MFRIFGATLLTLVLFAPAPAADWPGFAGPRGDYTTDETDLTGQWGPEGPEQLWSVEIGPGFGGPAVVGDEVFLLDRQARERDILRCFDLASGQEKWRYGYDAPAAFDFPGSRTVPAVDDERVYIVGPTGMVHAVSRESHEPVWSMDMLREFGGRRPGWAVSVSPLLVDDMVIIAPQGRYAALAGLDRQTGEVLWRSESVGHDMAYSSPILVEIDGVRQVLLHVKQGVISVAPETGETLWRYGGYRCNIPIATPTVLPDGRVFITGEYGAGSAMIRPSRDEQGAWSVEQLYKTDDCGSQLHPALLIDDHLYLVSYGNRRREGLMCITPDAEVLWRLEGDPEIARGSILYADGKIYACGGESGVVHVFAPSPEAPEHLGQFQALEQGQKWAPMALSQGRLLVRDQGRLKCFDVRQRQ